MGAIAGDGIRVGADIAVQPAKGYIAVATGNGYGLLALEAIAQNQKSRLARRSITAKNYIN
jgi:hypothetical protein